MENKYDRWRKELELNRNPHQKIMSCRMLFLKAMSWWYDNIDTTHEHYGLGLVSWLRLTVYSWNVSAPEGQPEHKLSVITNLGDQIILVISACWIVWVALQGSKSEISEFRVKSKLDPSLFLSSVQTGPARKLHASPDWSCQTEAGTSNHTGPQLMGDAEGAFSYQKNSHRNLWLSL